MGFETDDGAMTMYQYAIKLAEFNMTGLVETELTLTLNQIIEKMGAPKGTTYDQLDAGQQAHVDAYCEQFDDEIDHDGGQCFCGEYNCPDAYVHATSGW